MTARNILLSFLFVLGTGAVFGGGVLMLSPKGLLMGMPLSMLEHSPFSNFLIPGIVLFIVLGVAPVCVAIALIKKPDYKLAERFNFFTDMYWGWSYCIYIVFALIIWIQLEMVFLRAVHWAHTVYIFFALLILFVTLLPEVRQKYKK